MKLVTLKACDNVMEAEIIKSKLESENINCLIDSGVASINPLLTIAVGGIKILVRDDDLDKAKLLINE